MHGLARESMVVTGAPRFDPWFDRRPSRTRRELADAAGLDPERPYLLYLCSSAFIAPNELPFVERWLARVQADAELAELGVLIRPHPQNAGTWRDADVAARPNVAIWPRGGENVDDDTSRNDFYDSLAHSAAVVGINTSALIEAAIVGKNVFTVVDETFAQTQTGTLHFHYLRHEHGGFLREAATLDEHVDQLRAGIEAAATDLEQTRTFVEAFVRPRGLDRTATSILAEEIEQLALVRAAPLPSSLATSVLRVALYPAAAFRRARGRRDRRAASGTVRP
jgi:hypothetical protein